MVAEAAAFGNINWITGDNKVSGLPKRTAIPVHRVAEIDVEGLDAPEYPLRSLGRNRFHQADTLGRYNEYYSWSDVRNTELMTPGGTHGEFSFEDLFMEAPVHPLSGTSESVESAQVVRAEERAKNRSLSPEQIKRLLDNRHELAELRKEVSILGSTPKFDHRGKYWADEVAGIETEVYQKGVGLSHIHI